ncbi:hypothetical protein [Luteimonas pelagia]
MSLKKALGAALTEEDVKDAYIKALGLKKYTKGLIDIRTDEIWFEAKETSKPAILMFAQLLCYVREARKKGEHVPPFLAVIDREKAAIMETSKALGILADKSIKWPKSGSAVARATADQMAPYIETHFVVYKLDSHEREFIEAVKYAIKAGKFVRTPITPDNLRQVFDRWVEMIGRELVGVNESDFPLLFFADIMHDGSKAAMPDLPVRLLHEGDRPVFLLNGTAYELASEKGYRNFWAIYHRPPEEEHRAYLLERRDSLLALDERSFKGAYYTPLHIVDKAYDTLAQILGKNWQRNYIVWDMCCGVGNLEVKHSNHRNIFMSTLDQADIDVMRASRTCVAATKFQYDYLNDDVDDFGQIDYSLTDKVPMELRRAVLEAKEQSRGAKKILVLINPPYAEAANSQGNAGKTGVASTRIAASMEGMGKATNELFVQFLVRIQRELPNAVVAMFSTLKYVNAPNFAKFRELWSPKYLGGFVVHSKAFDGVKGNFPIGFLIWDTSVDDPDSRLETIALDKDGAPVGEKTFYRVEIRPPLSSWVRRPRADSNDAVPLKNAISPADSTKDARGRWVDGAIGSLMCNGNDVQNAGTMTALFSSVHAVGHAGGFFVTKENLSQAAVVFAVRRLIKPTWLNDRDQFLQPSGALSGDFVSDCLIWMLFNGSNLTAGANELQWNGRAWSLVNHFLPFTEQEVGAPGRFESNFMSEYLATIRLSREAADVIDEGRKLWQKYHATSFERKVREELKLNRSDVGWYQIRRALEAYSDRMIVSFDPMRTVYAALSAKLRPQVYQYGFLRL